MTKYLLKSNTAEGVVYYMNVICITEQPECAEEYDCVVSAQKDMQHFANLLQNIEHEPIEIVERKD